MSAKTTWVEVGVEASVGSDGKKVLITGTIPLGGRTIKGETCKPQELVAWWDAECWREEPTTDPLDPHLPPKVEKEELFLYFEHALIALRRDPKGAAVATPSDEVDAILHSDPKSGTARLNRRTLERLPYLLRQGYVVRAIEGYASPEGRRPGPQATDQGELAKWEGNIALACRRAEKVSKLNLHRDYSKYLYFIDGDGSVCQKEKSGEGESTVLVKNAVSRDNHYLYFIDKEGDISRSPRGSRGATKKAA